MDKLKLEDVIDAVEAITPKDVEEGLTFISGLQAAIHATLEGMNKAIIPDIDKLPPGAAAEGISEETPGMILASWLAGTVWLAKPWAKSSEKMNFQRFFATLLAMYWKRLTFGGDFDTPEDGVDRLAEVVYFSANVSSLIVSSGNGFSPEQADSLSEKLSVAIATAINDTVTEFRKTSSFNPELN